MQWTPSHQAKANQRPYILIQERTLNRFWCHRPSTAFLSSELDLHGQLSSVLTHSTERLDLHTHSALQTIVPTLYTTRTTVQQFR
ncbi:hypothetical protein CLOM_g3760 [Closterium sp. NIES-68]|nr:hypothetical protein CLOM_g2497 [Closterium sp. NIES-68]GJP44381.1 hypothetical protein CLOM_g3760 [Closterium sp. NIES-68]